MINYEIMSGSEIGRRFAPEGIKDRAGWGRKTLRKIKEMGASVKGGLMALEHIKPHQSDFNPFPRDAHQYKAPHANRGTPPRPHYSRWSQERKLFHI